MRLAHAGPTGSGMRGARPGTVPAWSGGLRHAHDSASSDGSRALCIACPPVWFRHSTEPRESSSFAAKHLSGQRLCVGQAPFFFPFFLFSTAGSGMPHAAAAGGASGSRDRVRVVVQVGGPRRGRVCVSWGAWPALQGTASRPATVTIIWTRRLRPARRTTIMIACCRCIPSFTRCNLLLYDVLSLFVYGKLVRAFDTWRARAFGSGRMLPCFRTHARESVAVDVGMLVVGTYAPTHAVAYWRTWLVQGGAGTSTCRPARRMSPPAGLVHGHCQRRSRADATAEVDDRLGCMDPAGRD